MLDLPKWKILHGGGITTIQFALAGIHICDVSYDNVGKKTIRFYMDTLDFDTIEIVIQIANDKINILPS